MRYRILGVLAVRDAEITAGRERVVLAMLLLHPNRIVGADRLIDAVWGDRPPATARAQLQTCVSRLRRVLPPGTILTNPAGYGITVADADLDALTFEQLTLAARAEPEPDGAAARLRRGLDLWRGPALGDIDSAAVRRLAATLDERYAVAVEDWVELELDRGHDRELLGELSALVDRFPLREGLRGQLMRTLCRAGRRADALAEYRRTRAVFAGELGIEPGPELRDLHRRILAGDLPGPPTWAAAGPVRCLPRAVGDFTGRDAVLDRFRSWLATAPAGPAVRVFDGMAGVGKTTLAIRLAELAADRYPDAHLFVDLHGHSARDAMDPGTALAALLRQLEVPPDRIPGPVEDRVALWRSELARRRAVVVLDNAATSAQIVPLLPGSGTSLTLVTSRRRLGGLDDIRPQPLPVLTEAEAADLFIRVAGERAAAEPAAVAEVVRRCGLLPLAIRLAAARLSARRRWRVADLVHRLADAALPELATEDRTVAAAFGLSYGQLAAPHQRLFRLLGLYPGERFDATTAAALADLPLAGAEDLLDVLTDVHLVEEPEPGAFRLHDLMREYAATLAGADPAECHEARLRLFDHTLHGATAVAATLEHPLNRRTLRMGVPRRPDLVTAAAADPHRWLAGQGRDYLAIQVLAESSGVTGYVWRLARAAWRMWYLAAQCDELIEAHERGLVAAEAEADGFAVAVLRNFLASGLYRVGRLAEAAEMLDAAHAGFVKAGDVVAAVAALGNLAVVRLAVGDLDGAATVARDVLARADRLNDLSLSFPMINMMGTVAHRRGWHAESLHWHRRELMVAAATGPAAARYNSLSNVGIARMHLGHAAAERILRLAVSLNRRIRNLTAVAEAAGALGVLYRRRGDFATATRWHRMAVDTAADATSRALAAETLIDFGETLLAAGDRAGAAERFKQAGELAHRTSATFELARSLAGLGAAVAAADPSTARRHYRDALALFRRMNVPPTAEAVQQRLAGL